MSGEDGRLKPGENGISKSVEDQQPKRLMPRHRALMRKLIAGKTVRDAAEELGYTEHRAGIISRSPLFIAEKERMEAGVDKEFVEIAAAKDVEDMTRKQLKDSTLKAAETLKGALDDDSTSARIRAASDILDRTGYMKEEKVRTDVLLEAGPGLLNALARVMAKEEDGIPTAEPETPEGSGTPPV